MLRLVKTLQGGDIHRDKTTVLPVAKGGWFEDNDGKDEEIVKSERQQQTLDISHNQTGANNVGVTVRQVLVVTL